MKVLNIFSVVAGAIFLLSGTVVNAANKTATAPADYLAKTNPYDVDDMDDIKKSAKKLYKRKCKKCHGKKVMDRAQVLKTWIRCQPHLMNQVI